MTTRDLFLNALEIDSPEERMQWLHQQCANDPEQLDDVLSLLSAEDLSGDFLETPLFEPGSDCEVEDRDNSRTYFDGSAEHVDAGPPTQMMEETLARVESMLEPATSPDSIGALPGYDVLEVLGAGGMGVVFRGDDLKLKRVVALKMLAPEFAANATARKRFLREAQAAASVNHVNVVTIYAVDEAELPFLVMECVDGISLQEKLVEQGALDECSILRVARQIAEGLGAAHLQGLIHRDIKPANILLENGIERVKLTDFGLARAIDDVSITQTGQIAGTPEYMSPEQTRGERIDHRSDLFSLGCVLYAMCTGRSPFRGQNTLAVIRRINDDIPRPIRDINPEISPALVDVIMTLLEKDPAARYQSASEVSTDISRMIQMRTNPPQDETPTGEAHQSVPHPHRFRRFLWPGVVLLLLGLIIGTTEATGKTNVTSSVIRLIRGDGTLVVETFDPEISVSLNEEELIFKGAGLNEIRIAPGEYKLLASKDGKPVHSEVFTLTRGGERKIRIGWEPAGKETVEEPPTEIVRSSPDSQPAKPPVKTEHISEPVAVSVASSGHQPAREPEPLPELEPGAIASVPFDPAEARAFQLRTAEMHGIPESVTNSVGMTLRLVPPGTFQMGIAEGNAWTRQSPLKMTTVSGVGVQRTIRHEINESQPSVTVTLTSPYYLASHEVTQRQYQEVMETDPGKHQSSDAEAEREEGTDTSQHPVENITWELAVTFCNRLSEMEGLSPCYRVSEQQIIVLPDGTGYRLPTSAEWEFACRAGSALPFYASSATKLKEIAWYHDDPEVDRNSHPVGSLIPNAFGLHDMLGNVSEYVWDAYEPYEANSPALTNPGGKFQSLNKWAKRIIRGGHYNSPGQRLHIGHRISVQMPSKSYAPETIGFRVVRVVPDSDAP